MSRGGEYLSLVLTLAASSPPRRLAGQPGPGFLTSPAHTQCPGQHNKGTLALSFSNRVIFQWKVIQDKVRKTRKNYSKHHVYLFDPKLKPTLFSLFLSLAEWYLSEIWTIHGKMIIKLYAREKFWIRYISLFWPKTYKQGICVLFLAYPELLNLIYVYRSSYIRK